ncbi:MAG: DUF4254 domain-containing protein [Bacteroidota bacterium]
MKSAVILNIFEEAIRTYYGINEIFAPMPSPYPSGSIEALLFQKNWIDNKQWNLEDVVRDRQTPAEKGIQFKWEIDSCNQLRTDTVEELDDIFFKEFSSIHPLENAFINTETPAWAIDRLSILSIKIYHMSQKVELEKDQRILQKSMSKLEVLKQQRVDLSLAIDQLFENIRSGRCIIKTYKQMKMYNDPDFNPFLRETS